MNNSTFSIALALLFTGASAMAQPTQLKPASERVSDDAIQADHQAYKTLQERIHQLNERGVPVRDYHLSKAQCWLDVSLHEYTRNDRSAFPQEALTESEKLIVALENKAKILPMDTPLVNGAARLRPDLWERTGVLKQDSGFQCAWPKVACAEVELVHAGNEFNQQQWRHAKPYVQIAEELVSEADVLVAQCPKPPVAPKVVVVPAPLPPVPVALSASVLFDFDKHTPDHIRSASRTELENLMARVKLEGITITSLVLVGHADRLNETGQKGYNQQLSQKRVNTVRDLLVAQGLTVSGASIEAKGDGDQILACQARMKKRADLEECLLPNRRVQVEIKGMKAARP
jgi:outer membrane protein OmpA-like peptidoglycan-associated protein